MHNLFHALPTGDNFPETIHVVIEIPQGSYVKYEYNEEFGVFAVDRVLHAPMPFPANYGFIPQCWNPDDNDPADALVIASHPLQTGVLCPSRVIGYFSMIDSGEKDDKVVCVPADDALLTHVQTVEDLPEHFRKQVEFYFSTYKQIQKKTVEVKGFGSKEEAIAHIEHGMEVYKEKFGA